MIIKQEDHARRFVPESNPEWSLGSITNATPEIVFQRVKELMFQREQELETIAKDFGTENHRVAFSNFVNVWESVCKQANVKDS